jgi:hypothetical protein
MNGSTCVGSKPKSSAETSHTEDNCSLMCYYEVCSGNSLLTFREKLSFQEGILLGFLTLEDGTDRLPRSVGKE